MKKAVELITKSEVSFWFVIIGAIVCGVMAFSSLKAEVKALSDDGVALIKREQNNKTQFTELVKTVQDIDKGVVRIETNQQHLMRSFGLDVLE